MRAYAGVGDEVPLQPVRLHHVPDRDPGVGATPVTAPEKDYRTDVDALIARAGPKTKLCFLANPNNPTGTTSRRARSSGCAPACRRTWCW